VLPYLLVFGVGAVVTFATTPVVRSSALRLGWIDHPSDRKVHPKPTATTGGLSLLLGVSAALLVARLVPSLREVFASTSDPDAAIVGGLVILAVGLLDDTRGLSPLGKLAGQILAAGILVLLGVQLLYFYFPGRDILVLSPDMAVPLTVLWVVGMINAVNLIDGLDGLAAGMVAIAAMAFFAYMYRGEPSTAALLSAIVAGSALGFLPWNFHPARIFMGDTGSGFLGLVMAVATISGVGRNLEGPTGGDLAVIAIPVAVPLLVLAVPFLDVLLAIARRVRRGIGIAHADKEHIHHRLLDIGHSHRQAVFLMYLWAALISTCALAVAFIDGRLLVSAILAVAAVVAAVLPRLIREGRLWAADRTVHVAPAEAAVSDGAASPNGDRHAARPAPSAPAPPSAPQPVGDPASTAQG
jgi:UDP-GlcNAc:undecaprenyl-phosphate/decaprenyl-phosphate GlcNAc-1-phosphate transferase